MMVWNGLGLPDGRIVVRALVRTSDLFGYPLHILGTRAAREKSFGAAKNAAFDGSVPKVNGTLALAGANRFWTSAMSQYKVSLWSTAGQLLKVIDRQAEWFPAWDSWDGRMDVVAPVPRLVATWQDRQGRLLTLSNIASVDWKPVPGRRAEGESAPATVREFDDANDSIIEVLDPVRGEIVATGRFKHALTRFVDDSLVAGVSEESPGGVVVEIWKIRLIPQSGGRK
jgi:hypothetical protein